VRVEWDPVQQLDESVLGAAPPVLAAA